MATRIYGIGRQGAVVHIVHDVRQTSEDRVVTTWKCNRSFGAVNAIHLNEVGNRARCARCVIAADDTDERRIYVARVDGLIKVGTSNQVGLRLSGLKGELVAWVPGGFDKERVVLDNIEAAPVRGREWFPAEAEEQILTVLMAVA